MGDPTPTRRRVCENTGSSPVVCDSRCCGEEEPQRHGGRGGTQSAGVMECWGGGEVGRWSGNHEEHKEHEGQGSYIRDIEPRMNANGRESEMGSGRFRVCFGSK